MKTIYKYKLDKNWCCEIPIGSKILSAQIQDNEIVLWAIVDTRNELENIKINCFVTGEKINECIMQEYITTIQLGSFVFHLFKAA